MLDCCHIGTPGVTASFARTALACDLSGGRRTATLRVHMRQLPRREPLHPHPSYVPSSVHALTVAVDWGASLTLHYELRGNVDALRIPVPVVPQHTDELWRHTCCELFITTPGIPGYREFNFSPGGPWAAYGFNSYRSGMRALDISPPIITVQVAPTQLDVRVELMLDAPPLTEGRQELHCALTAVVEEQSGARSFWALVHAAAQPDFHHADGFALHLTRSLQR
jgi:hypothetical protein